MKKAIHALLFFSLPFFACSQTTIRLDEVKNHVGDSVKVCGKVYSARFMENIKNTPAFLNIGAAFPNQLLTVVIWGDARTKFETKPEEQYAGKEICISGKIELYKEKAQMDIKELAQITCTNYN